MMHIFEDGVYLGSARVNENGDRNYPNGRQSHGLSSGTYDIPKPACQMSNDGISEWPIGTPSVTGFSFLNQPGRAGQDYKPNVRIHQKGASGRADSLGCITTDQNSVGVAKRVMDYEISRGESLYLKIVLWSGVPYALPR
jgi:hypothetical protein